MTRIATNTAEMLNTSRHLTKALIKHLIPKQCTLDKSIRMRKWSWTCGAFRFISVRKSTYILFGLTYFFLFLQSVSVSASTSETSSTKLMRSLLIFSGKSDYFRVKEGSNKSPVVKKFFLSIFEKPSPVVFFVMQPDG